MSGESSAIVNPLHIKFVSTLLLLAFDISDKEKILRHQSNIALAALNVRQNSYHCSGIVFLIN